MRAAEPQAVRDLVQFAGLMVEGGDLEPWAAVLADMRGRLLDVEATHWAIVLYNTYDDLGAALAIAARWPGPYAWDRAPDSRDITKWMPAQERRNLRGGRVLRRMDSYLAHLDGGTQDRWLTIGSRALPDPGRQFVALTNHVRQVWGVGRQAAFEWVEFLGKVQGWRVEAPDAQLWESEGPRRALQRLYGNERPDRAWLEDAAYEARATISTLGGIDLSWEDFETVICDFNVMRDGRYYPGKHLGMIREEIETITDPEVHAAALGAFHAAIPEGWADVPPGVSKALQTQYRDTGRMVTEPWRQ